MGCERFKPSWGRERPPKRQTMSTITLRRIAIPPSVSRYTYLTSSQAPLYYSGPGFLAPTFAIGFFALWLAGGYTPCYGWLSSIGNRPPNDTTLFRSSRCKEINMPQLRESLPGGILAGLKKTSTVSSFQRRLISRQRNTRRLLSRKISCPRSIASRHLSTPRYNTERCYGRGGRRP